MKKRVSRAMLIAVIAIIVVCALAAVLFLGKRPYKNMVAYEIEYAEVYGTLAGGMQKSAVTDTEALASLLRDLRVLRKAPAFSAINGTVPTFSVIKTDGNCLEIAVKAPYVMLNGVCFRAAKKPCKALEHFGQEMLGLRFELGESGN